MGLQGWRGRCSLTIKFETALGQQIIALGAATGS